jgi:poly-gamma-glutamate synthesis protein (capsule biosynthesis protein)
VSLANNHLRDAGDRGVLDTIAACTAAGLAVVGAGADERAASVPLVFDLGTWKLGILSVAEREFSIAGVHRPGAAPLEPYSTPAQVLELRARTDAVIAIVHGGNEFSSLPSPRLKALAHALAACGASAVVCHHQHVHGGLEVTGGTAIAYGTGNFYFPPRFSQDPRWRRGYAVSLVVGKGEVDSFRVLPYRQSDPEPTVQPLTERELTRSAADILSLSRTLADDEALKREWSLFCARRRTSYLSRILGLTKLEQAALKRGIWPFWRLSRSQLPTLLNLFTCEAHRETLTSVLEAELAASSGDAPQEESR